MGLAAAHGLELINKGEAIEQMAAVDKQAHERHRGQCRALGEKAHQHELQAARV